MKRFILKSIKPLVVLMIIAFTAIACDKDFVNVESDIRGAQNFSTSSRVFPFIAYNKKLEGVQTSGLSSNVLGIYNDPNYGSTAASFISQITPDDLAPDFGDNPSILSVKLYLPYFSTVTETDEDGNSTYTLDSIYGDSSSPFKLSIYKSSYFLRNLDPETNFEDEQAYYSNAYTNLNLEAFEEQLLYPADPNQTFTPSALEHVIQAEVEPGEDPEVEERLAPGIYVDLNDPSIVPANFWEDIIFAADGSANPAITNAADFKNFFRGLILKVEQNDTSVDGSLLFLDLTTNAKVEIKYEYDGDDAGDRETGTYTFNFNGNKFNTFKNLSNFTPLTDGNSTSGDDQLFIKGFEGSMTVLDLFNGNIIDENNATQDSWEYFKGKNGQWLINEANLNLYVDHSAYTGGTSEPDRIMIYDLKNNLPIIDYFVDVTSNSTDPYNSKIIYSPKLERDDSGNGVKYKIRLTEHINNILLNDSTNTKLGIYVTNNINLFGTSKVFNTNESNIVNIIPQSSVIAPEGTILYGNTPAVPENVRASFEIFYTEPEN
ncbi:DUF4270 domain-containing protein [Olleya sp. UBA1516]|uniref:DUF4270 domain-containing protein n=1 Tax=Olleya sp. UBA1516 TaxID=1947013 RepID=UPI0025D4B0E2|nr:DUF4270 domain-containing protein [Olleya sp. UBA1516]|tara:strand:- start:7555 stop:9189 length:1635 start_codon:yes stop_codon:yes gene_type:complete